MGLKRNKSSNVAATNENQKIPKLRCNLQATIERCKPLRKSVIIPKNLFEALGNHLMELPPMHRNVFLSVKEYPVEEINPLAEKDEDTPTHLVIFCIRLIITEEFNPLGVIHVNKRLHHTDQLTTVWKAFIQDLSKLNVNVVASISPCTQMYRDILSKLTNDPNLENHSQPIFYQVYPYYMIVHLYDNNSLMQEFQEVFCKNDLFFICPSKENSSDSSQLDILQLHTASWSDISPIFTSASFKRPCSTKERRNIDKPSIFTPKFQMVYFRAMREGLQQAPTRLSTNILLDKLWAFAKLTHKSYDLFLKSFEKFYKDNRDLQIILASAHFNNSNTKHVEDDNCWYKTFQNNELFEENGYETDHPLQLEDKLIGSIINILDDSINNGEIRLESFLERLKYDKDAIIFFQENQEESKLMKKGSKISQLVREFMEDTVEKENHGIKKKPKNSKNKQILKENHKTNILNDNSHTNPFSTINQSVATRKKRHKKSKSPLPNEDLMLTGYETPKIPDPKCEVHYLDNVLDTSREGIKNYLESFGYSMEDFYKIYMNQDQNPFRNKGKSSRLFNTCLEENSAKVMVQNDQEMVAKDFNKKEKNSHKDPKNSVNKYPTNSVGQSSSKESEEISRFTSVEQINPQATNKEKNILDSGYSSTTSLDQVFSFMCVDLMKNNKKTSIKNAVSAVTQYVLSNKEHCKNVKSKVWGRDDLFEDESKKPTKEDQEKIVEEPKTDSTKNCTKIPSSLDILAELASKCGDHLIKSKKHEEYLTEEENFNYNLYTKDSMDKFFDCFEPKHTKKKNNISMNFLEKMCLLSPCCLIPSTSQIHAPSDEFKIPVALPHYTRFTSLDNSDSGTEENAVSNQINPEKIENFATGVNLETNFASEVNVVANSATEVQVKSDQNDEDEIFPGIYRENFNCVTEFEKKIKDSQQISDAEEIDYIDYRKHLVSTLCDKEQYRCDVINFKDKEHIIELFNTIPKRAKIMRITTDWLCTLKGYLKLTERLEQRQVSMIKSNVLCLDHVDFFASLISQRNYETLGKKKKKEYFVEKNYKLIDAKSVWEMLRWGGRYIINQNNKKSL